MNQNSRVVNAETLKTPRRRSATTHLLSSVYIVAFMGLSAYYFGVNDRVSMFLIVASIFLLYPVIIVGQMTIRNAAKTNFQDQTLVYQLLNKEKTMLQRIISLILAVILSISFLVIAKVVVIEHGFFTSLMIVFFVAIIASALIQSSQAVRVENGTLKEEVTRHRGPDLSFLGLFIAVFVANIILATVLSAAETHKFLGNDVDIGNFVYYASERAISRLDTNELSRVLINVYIIMDAFKLGVVNELLSAFSIHKENFYWFYALVFVLNLLKLFAFSLPLIILQRSLIAASERVEKPVLSFSRWARYGIVHAFGSVWGLGAKQARKFLRFWRSHRIGPAE